jgi:hypothetical protein
MEMKFNKITGDTIINLFRIYSQNKLLYISYLENGYTNNVSGMIKNIDFVKKEITMISSKKIPFLNILNISEIS